MTVTPLTCPIECAVLVGVQADHLADSPHVVPQHDTLSLHHEEVCVGWRRDQKRKEAVKALRIRRRKNRGRGRSGRMRRRRKRLVVGGREHMRGGGRGGK